LRSRNFLRGSREAGWKSGCRFIWSLDIANAQLKRPSFYAQVFESPVEEAFGYLEGRNDRRQRNFLPN
jgi:hypothetical protein